MISEIKAKTIIRKHKKIDSWFVSGLGMNLYRGCQHNCVYCDGRAEGYFVKGEFGTDVEVKVNAPEIVRKELALLCRKNFQKKGFAMLGGGVCDAYQPAEAHYKLSSAILEWLAFYNFPVHILTKSLLIKRDIDLLKRIHHHSRAVVSFSFSSVSDAISKVFEPGVHLPTERLALISFLKDQGIPCGMFLMPVIPFISDTDALIEESVSKACDAGVDFIIFGGMTLKEGKQKDHYFNVLKNYNAELTDQYRQIYTPSKWGNAVSDYYMEISKRFHVIARRYGMPVRMPLRLFRDILDENELVIVMLEHMDYLLQERGEKPPFGYASRAIAKLQQPLSEIKTSLSDFNEINISCMKVILEILETRTCGLYEKLTKNSSSR